MPHNQAAHSTSGQTWNDVLPMSFWTAAADPWGVSGAAGLGFVIDFTAAMKKREEEPTKQDDMRLIESVGQNEHWYEKLENSFHMREETLTQSAFLGGAEAFLRSVGLDGPTQVSVNEETLPPGEPQPKLDLKQALEAWADFIGKNNESVRSIEITSHGKNENFSFLVDFAYKRKHLPVVPPIELEVRAMSNALGPLKGEAFVDYRARMNALDTDPQRRKETYDQIEAGKKAAYADFAHHLSEAFPGVRLQFYERLAPGET